MKLYKKKNAKEVQNNAALYARGKDRTNELRQEFVNALNREIERLYHRFVSSSTTVTFEQGQPYETHKDMKEDFFRNGVLRVSQDHNESTIFSKSCKDCG